MAGKTTPWWLRAINGVWTGTLRGIRAGLAALLRPVIGNGAATDPEPSPAEIPSEAERTLTHTFPDLATEMPLNTSPIDLNTDPQPAPEREEADALKEPDFSHADHGEITNTASTAEGNSSSPELTPAATSASESVAESAAELEDAEPETPAVAPQAEVRAEAIPAPFEPAADAAGQAADEINALKEPDFTADHGEIKNTASAAEESPSSPEIAPAATSASEPVAESAAEPEAAAVPEAPDPETPPSEAKETVPETEAETGPELAEAATELLEGGEPLEEPELAQELAADPDAETAAEESAPAVPEIAQPEHPEEPRPEEPPVPAAVMEETALEPEIETPAPAAEADSKSEAVAGKEVLAEADCAAQAEGDPAGPGPAPDANTAEFPTELAREEQQEPSLDAQPDCEEVSSAPEEDSTEPEVHPEPAMEALPPANDELAATDATQEEPAAFSPAAELGTSPEAEAESQAEAPKAITEEQPQPEPQPTPSEAAAGSAGAQQAPVAASQPPSAAVPPEKPVHEPIKREDGPDTSPVSVMVSQVYEGPLDLLLDLIRKQDIDIYDIPIARITAQFLVYVDRLKAADMDVAGEFIYMASLLIHIKSKMLLPRAPAGPDDVPEDPRRELVEKLLEHERFKNAAQMLQQKQMLEAASWSNPGLRDFKDDESAEAEIAADTTDLVRVFRVILDRARNRPMINVEEDTVTVGQMIQFLGRRLSMEDKPLALRRLLSHTKSERALIAMFLALLELVRLQAILLRQDRQFSEILIKKNTAFDAVMNQGLARDDWQ